MRLKVIGKNSDIRVVNADTDELIEGILKVSLAASPIGSSVRIDAVDFDVDVTFDVDDEQLNEK